MQALATARLRTCARDTQVLTAEQQSCGRLTQAGRGMLSASRPGKARCNLLLQTFGAEACAASRGKRLQHWQQLCLVTCCRCRHLGLGQQLAHHARACVLYGVRCQLLPLAGV